MMVSPPQVIKEEAEEVKHAAPVCEDARKSCKNLPGNGKDASAPWCFWLLTISSSSALSKVKLS